MKTVTFERAVNAGRLLTALSQLSGLTPTTRTVDGEQRQYARVNVSSDGATVRIDVPDNFDATRLDAVLAAHDATPDVVTIQPTRAALLQAIASAGSLAEVKSAVIAALDRALR